MNSPSRLMALIMSLLSLAVMSCGGSSASGGIGGSGITANSIGPVSETGSITVNGVRFETTSATITDDDGNAFNEADLQVGFVVEVSGELNTNGTSGNASQVSVITAVQGPVELIDLANSQLTVLGQPVAVDDLTVFDNTIAPNNLSGLSIGQNVEISGTVDPSGTVRANRIETEPALTIFKVRGFIDTATTTTFIINGLSVDFSAAVMINFGGNSPAINDFVTVKGAILAGNTLTADSVENSSRSFDDDENAEIEGFIITAATPSFTLVSGAGTFNFQTDGATEFIGGAPEDLISGVKVEVEGAFSGGVLIADKVSIKSGIRLRATTDTVDLVNRLVYVINLSAIELKFNNQTEIEDDRTGTTNSTPTADELLPTLSQGAETLRVRARLSADSALALNATQLIVTELRVRDLEGTVNDIRLRGPLEAPPGANDELIILGVDITTTNAIVFLDEADIAITRTSFFNQVTTGASVEAQGTFSGDNTINAIELEIEN